MRNRKRDEHSGSTFDSFLEEEGLLARTEAIAIKRVLAWQLRRAMAAKRITKKAMARQLRTSRSQVDRLLDPVNVSVSLASIARAAKAVGKRVTVQMLDFSSGHMGGTIHQQPVRARRRATKVQKRERTTLPKAG